MSKTIDLHTHSYCSDGSMSPTQLVLHAKEQGLSAIALTDHDTVAGLPEARRAARDCGLELINGIEFSVIAEKGETHILGYFIDDSDPLLLSVIDELMEDRRSRNRMVSENLKKLGMPVSVEEARAEANSEVIGRAHFAKVMVKKGYVGSVKEAFDRVLSPGQPGFFPSLRAQAHQAIEWIRHAGGIAVAAHLHHTQRQGDELEAFIRELKGYGLQGVEGYYSEYTPQQHQEFCDLAKKLDLVITGGTDFHGQMKPHIAIGKGFGGLEIPYGLLEPMRLLTNGRENDTINKD